jgi:O-methyltransferase
MKASELPKRYRLISDQIDKTELAVIIRELSGVVKDRVDGDVVEFGCYVGTSSLFIRRTLNILDGKREFHVYDSFAGLPEKSAKDLSPAGQQYQSGRLAASRKQLLTNFKKAGLAPPIVHKNWFNELSDKDLPENIAFAFLDGDFYESIADCLNLVGPKMSSGGRIVVDDYQSEALPGVKKAVDEWLYGRQLKLRVESSLAIIG